MINSADVFFRPIEDIEGISKKWHITYNHGLFASENYIKRMGLPQTAEDLINHHLLCYGEYEFSYFEDVNWHLKGKKFNLPKLTPSLSINSTGALYQASSEGLGICSAPIESNLILKKNLIHILPEIVGPSIQSSFCVRDDIGEHKKESITLFQTFIEEYLTKQGVEYVYTKE